VTRPIGTSARSFTTRRRTVRLTAITDEAGVPDAPHATEAGAPPRAGRGLPLPTSRDDWLVLAERMVGDWAATLRAALLLLVAVAAVIMVVGLAFGAGPAMATAFLALLVFLAGRRRGAVTRR
jgi:hypothetical protein